jgi:hypothetical protein
MPEPTNLDESHAHPGPTPEGIPQRHQEICKALARVAREQGLNSFSGSYRPGDRDGWMGEISFRWSRGRHDEDANEIRITSEHFVETKIDTPASG